MDSDSSRVVTISEMMKELLPANHIQTMSPEDWMKVKKVDRGVLQVLQQCTHVKVLLSYANVTVFTLQYELVNIS